VSPPLPACGQQAFGLAIRSRHGKSRFFFAIAAGVVRNHSGRRSGLAQTAKKVLRAQRIAFECALPLIYLVDSSGIFLPMQD
jgi:acetyl-CoA carboxylase carboxyltransferase component